MEHSWRQADRGKRLRKEETVKDRQGGGWNERRGRRVVSTSIYNKSSIAYCQSNQMCPYMICRLCGIESIWGLGTLLRRITPLCQYSVFSQSHTDSGEMIYTWPNMYIVHLARMREKEEHGGCVWWDILAALSIWWYEGGREQEKQTGPCLRAELGGGSAPQ